MTSEEFKKHPDVVAWEEWANSYEGKRCLAGIAEGIYLRNRLLRAFMAGREGKEKS